VEIKSRKSDRASGRSQVLTHKVAELVDELVGEDKRSSVSILSFDKDVLSLFHKLDPRWSLIWNVDSIEQVENGYTSWMSGVGLAVRDLKPQLCDYVHGRHGVVMTYTCNTVSQLKKACESGVDLIMTDDPCLIIDIIKQQGGGD
jgi:glycerophosphoryl diester phosphodiesterase